MADRCVWCDLDGRAGCPDHVDRWAPVARIGLLCALVLVALAVLGALR